MPGGSVNKQEIDQLFDNAIVIDGLGGDLVPSDISQRKAGLTAANLTVASPHADFMATAKSIYEYLTVIDALPNELLLVETLADIQSAKESNRFGVIFGLQDSSALGTDLTRLTLLHKLGVRVMTLTYNERNPLGDGCMEIHDLGITNFGMQVVRDMNRLGIVLDLSHSSERTTLDAIKLVSKPPVFSHSNPKARTPSPRNITDEQIKAVADVDGLVGISVYSPITYATPGVRPTVDDFLDHMEYVIDLIGIDKVGIGSDIFAGKGAIMWRATTKRRYPEMVGEFDMDTIATSGYSSHPEIRNVAYGLSKRGYSHEDIIKLIGGNWMRIFEQNLS